MRLKLYSILYSLSDILRHTFLLKIKLTLKLSSFNCNYIFVKALLSIKFSQDLPMLFLIIVLPTHLWFFVESSKCNFFTDSSSNAVPENLCSASFDFQNDTKFFVNKIPESSYGGIHMVLLRQHDQNCSKPKVKSNQRSTISLIKNKKTRIRIERIK